MFSISLHLISCNSMKLDTDFCQFLVANFKELLQEKFDSISWKIMTVHWNQKTTVWGKPEDKKGTPAVLAVAPEAYTFCIPRTLFLVCMLLPTTTASNYRSLVQAIFFLKLLLNTQKSPKMINYTNISIKVHN